MKADSDGAYDRTCRISVDRRRALVLWLSKLLDDQYADLQKNFAEAYNRKDVDAMAAAFTEDAIRVTPSGMFVAEKRSAVTCRMSSTSTCMTTP